MSELSADDLIDAAELGEQTKAFLESDVGKSILLNIEADEKEAIETFLNLDPSHVGEVMKCQIALKSARKCREKLELLITVGENAKNAWRSTQNVS